MFNWLPTIAVYIVKLIINFKARKRYVILKIVSTNPLRIPSHYPFELYGCFMLGLCEAVAPSSNKEARYNTSHDIIDNL